MSTRQFTQTPKSESATAARPPSIEPKNTSLLALEGVDVDIIQIQDLSGSLEQLWIELTLQAGLFSPYYHPGFTRAVAAVRDDVEIALLKNSAGSILGILPFQRIADRVANPIGGRMNDFHCFILRPGATFDLKWLMEQIGISRWPFHAWDQTMPQLESFLFETMNSHFIDLTCGLDRYLEWLPQHSRTIKRLPQKIRSLQRNHGELRFEFDCRDHSVLEKLINLKRERFQRTHTFDILSVDWAANLLREIYPIQKPDFKSILSVLWAGDQLVAAQFGMMNSRLLHYWFPIYAPGFKKYSPGLQLMRHCCQSAGESGIIKIDMSYGDSTFKDRFCNAHSKVAAGVIDFNPVRFLAAKYRYHLRQKLKSIPFKKTLKIGLRKVFPGYGNWHFR